MSTFYHFSICTPRAVPALVGYAEIGPGYGESPYEEGRESIDVAAAVVSRLLDVFARALSWPQPLSRLKYAPLRCCGRSLPRRP